MSDTSRVGQEATGTLELPDNKATDGGGAAEALTTDKIIANLGAALRGEEADPQKSGQELPPEQPQDGQKNLDSQETQETEEEEQPHQRAEWPDSAQKRVDKLTAQKAELKTTLDTLTTEKAQLEQALAEAKATPKGEAVNTSDPLGFITTPKDLSNFVVAIKGNLRSIEDFLDDALPAENIDSFKGWAEKQGAYNKETDQFDTAKLKQLRRLANDTLAEAVPARLQFLQTEAKAGEEAEKLFPWLKDPKSADHKTFNEVANALPEVKRLPHWKSICGIYVEGLKAMQAQQAKAKAGNGKGSTAPAKAANPKLPGAATVIPQRSADDAGAKITALRDKAVKSQNQNDWAAYTAALLEAA